MKPQTLHYRKRTGAVAPGIKECFKDFLTRENAITVIVAFLLGRIALIGGLMPFGFPLFVISYGLKVNRIAVAAAIMAGMVSRGDGRQIIITAAAILMYSAFRAFYRKATKAAAHMLALAAMACILVPGFIANIQDGFLLFDFITTLFHGFIVFTLVMLFKKAAIILQDERTERSLTSEEVISIAIIASLCAAGLSELKIAGFSIGNILCVAIILYFSYGYGPGSGSAVGLTAGLILSMSPHGNYMLISSYAFCGFMAGILGRIGKLGSCIGFLAGNAILTFYLTGSTQILIHILDIIAGIVVFAILQSEAGRRITGLPGNTLLGTGENIYGLGIREIIIEKLERFSRAFKELSATFEEVSHGVTAVGKNDISYMLDMVADKVCRDCGLTRHCWDRSFYNTYQVMFKIIDRLEKKGRVTGEDIPAYFIERCERINDFILHVGNVYELFKSNVLWKNRIDEAREIISAQMEGMSQIIARLALEMETDIVFRKDLGEKLVNALKKEKIKADDAVVFENAAGRLEVSVRHAGCSGSMPCVTVIERIAKEITGKKLVREGGECGKKRFGKGCLLKLVQERKYGVTTGVAQAPKHGNNVTGDSYTFIETFSGKYIAAISDGMGSGKAALKLSKATVSFIEQFMEAGFDKDTTIKMINSLLLLKSDEEAFATIDLVVLDMYEGKAEFVKVGSSPSFIKTETGIKNVRATSLPSGILNGVETEIQGKKLKSGDLVIMLSDGILAPFGEDGDRRIRELIGEMDSINPQHIADEIMDAAYSLCGGKPEDDMTAMVIKIWKRY
jgi:stage II sporulation protein E